jgi:preprotein translocase subunit SecE
MKKGKLVVITTIIICALLIIFSVYIFIMEYLN